jgi:CDP-diacylglycerol--serine O-phosphatidyltransferase
MKNRKYINVPNLFTSLNLFCGFWSVIQTANGKFSHAAWLIFGAAVFDALDGRIARASGQSSDFGLQMDSLSDVISAGIAPSFLVYEIHLRTLGDIGLLMAFLPLLFAAFRLARYNLFTLQNGKSQDYLGMPAPSAAVTLVSLVIFYLETDWPFLLRLLIAIVPLVSLMMASTVKYESFPRFSLKERGANRVKLVILFIVLILFIITPQYVLFPFMLIYLVWFPLQAVFAIFRNEETQLAIIPENDGDGSSEQRALPEK